MKKILIIGSNPSSKNLETNVPFVGTQSGKRLENWLRMLNIREYEIINASDKIGRVTFKDVDYNRLEKYMNRADKVIALGAFAYKAIVKAGAEGAWQLLHPSFRNFLLNDKNYEQEQLRKCKKWLFL